MPEASRCSRGGTYTLLVELDATATVEVGALGTVRFEPGWYAYVGSARGAGGFGRVDRHWKTTTNGHDVRHWHVDYLLGETSARVDAVTITREQDVECAVAAALEGEPIPNFGASDCECESHLVHYEHREEAVADVEDAHADR